MAQTILYPPMEPNRTGYLSVSDLHSIYWEETGKKDGVPVLFIHGGPGAGTAPVHRRFFDPNYYRIILFDQRGAGKSKPVAECRENTTQELIQDIERLRRFLLIDEWLVFGGSWGSTLAIAYGESYPERCKGFILRGIFLGSQVEIDWFINGMGIFFPEAYRKFIGLLSESEQKEPLAAYNFRLQHPDPLIHYKAAQVWSNYEQACSTLRDLSDIPDGAASPDEMLSLARIEAHYFMNQSFLFPNVLIKNIKKIASKPAIIIQGRYDVVCPIRTADSLARAWRSAEYEIIQEAGHSAMEPDIKKALIRATEKMKTI